MTDEEADDRCAEEIMNSLWAFNADFIIRHCRNFEDMSNFEYEAAIESLRSTQERCCENANGIVCALIDDMQDFIDDAIAEDGRGHFLSYYNGEENEQDGFYIYRTN